MGCLKFQRCCGNCKGGRLIHGSKQWGGISLNRQNDRLLDEQRERKDATRAFDSGRRRREERERIKSCRQEEIRKRVKPGKVAAEASLKSSFAVF